MFRGSSKEIYHSLLQQTRKFLASEFAHIIKILKKKNAGKNYKNTIGSWRKIARAVGLSRFYAHSQTQTPDDVKESQQSSSSKIICGFSIAGSMFYSQTRTVNSTQRHYKEFPFTRSPMTAH